MKINKEKKLVPKQAFFRAYTINVTLNTEHKNNDYLTNGQLHMENTALNVLAYSGH